ncbi:MAG: hypothetical protein H7X95_06505 [Deltaproteobacteria bacterium]|nr:hypothetical protein [Deltaproteobacteria bacterium]
MSRGSDEEILLSLVSKDGDSAGNVTLLRQLESRGWDEEKYWRVRAGLLDQGLLLRGKGKGGSIRRPIVVDVPVAAPAAPKPVRASAENALYEPLLKVLRTEWTREMRIESDQVHFEMTAWMGKKDTGGTWTRPDITAVSVRTFPHLPNKYLDIWTFEVKTADWLDVTAIFEAAAHGSRATRSYALLQVPEILDARISQIVNRCEREAERLRVGLITFTNPATFATWEFRVDAPRVDTAPEALEEFIAHLSDEAKKKLSRWK